MTLWLVRHAKPLVDAGVCYGTLDVPAEPEATAQAARALAAVLPQGLPVYHSPLQRCERLTHVLCALRPDLTSKSDARLAEMNFGTWEGVAWDQIPRAAVDAWTADFGSHRFGGVESANTVLQRVAAAWRDVGEDDAVWITHAGVIRAAMLVAQGVSAVDAPDQWPRMAADWGQWVVLPTQGSGATQG